jgi:hypothetical protein
MDMDTEYTVWIVVGDPDRVADACSQLEDLEAAPEADEETDTTLVAFTTTADDEDDAADRGVHAVERLADAGIDASVARVAKAT